MKIIETLEQGSQAWLDFRRTHITATDAGSIIGTNPYKSTKQLWEEKFSIRPPEVLNEAMKRGQDLEPIARQILIENTGIDFKPAVVVHDVESWCMASLDGLSPCNEFICEIKAPGIDTHQLALSGEIKPYYYSQIQHQLYVTGAKQCYYFSYYPEIGNPIAMIEILPDQEYIDKMIAMEKIFYEENICHWIEPEEKKLKMR